MVKELDRGHNRSKLDLQGKGIKLPYSSAMSRLVSLLFLLQRWFWYWITHESWYAIEQRIQTNNSIDHYSFIW